MKKQALKLTPEQILTAIDRLTPGERESLEILADDEITKEILQARERLRRGEGFNYEIPNQT